MLTHLWPTLDPVASVEEALRGFGRAVTLAAPHLSHPRLTRPADPARKDRRDHTRVRTRSPTSCGAVTFTRDYTEMADGLGARRVRPHPRAVHRVGRGARPAVAEGHGQGLGHRRVLDAAGLVARARRPRSRARASRAGRTQEIQRLIGRSLRAVTDLALMPDVQITVDCDVLQADGGTRTASICGGWIALHDACSRLVADGHARAAPDRCSRAPRSRSASSTARRCSTSSTPRTCAPRST